MQGSNHEMITICRVCINRLESRNADDDAVSVDDSLATPGALYDDAEGRVSHEMFAEIFLCRRELFIEGPGDIELGAAQQRWHTDL